MGHTRRWIDPRTRIAWVVSVRSVPERKATGGQGGVIVVFASIDGLWTIRERLPGDLDQLTDAELQAILDRAIEGQDWLEKDRDAGTPRRGAAGSGDTA